MVKASSNEQVDPVHLESSLSSLKHLIDSLDIKDISISSLTNRPLIIKEYHESAVGGHQGAHKLYERIRADFFWPNMTKEIANFTRTCPSCQRYKMLFTLQDNLTKYSDAIPLSNIDSTSVAIALAEQFISRFGCPRAIHTDQGTNFVSRIMNNF